MWEGGGGGGGGVTIKLVKEKETTFVRVSGDQDHIGKGEEDEPSQGDRGCRQDQVSQKEGDESHQSGNQLRRTTLVKVKKMNLVQAAEDQDPTF